MALIDVGEGCIDRSATRSPAPTYVAMGNPANATGTIDTVSVWANTNMGGIEYASFVDEGSNVLSTNGDTNGSNLTATAGECTEHTSPGHFSAFNINSGEYIGVYWASGALDRGTGGSGIWWITGDNIPASSVTFAPGVGGEVCSLYATGTEAGGAAVPTGALYGPLVGPLGGPI